MYKSALCCPLKKGRGLMSTFVMALLWVRSEFEQWDCLKVAPFSWRVARPETWEAVSSDPYLDTEGGIHNKIQQGTMQFFASYCWSFVKLETIVESLTPSPPMKVWSLNYHLLRPSWYGVTSLVQKAGGAKADQLLKNKTVCNCLQEEYLITLVAM